MPLWFTALPFAAIMMSFRYCVLCRECSLLPVSFLPIRYPSGPVMFSIGYTFKNIHKTSNIVVFSKGRNAFSISLDTTGPPGLRYFFEVVQTQNMTARLRYFLPVVQTQG